MTHQELQKIALSWLKRPISGRGPGCHIAMQEIGGHCGGERADAWGYRWGWGGGSVLVEVKISRSDFLADAKKPHRNGETDGMGTWRYYLCPEGLITLDDLPDGWGLLWVNKRGHIKPMAGHVCLLMGGYWQHDLIWFWAHQVNTRHELDMMAHLLSRVGDPEEMNRRIREAAASQAYLQRELERERTERKAASHRAMLLWTANQYLQQARDLLVASQAGQPIDQTTLQNLLAYCERLDDSASVRTATRKARSNTQELVNHER